MANLSTVLRTEIARVSRRESKSAIGQLRKAASAGRSEVAALRRRVTELEKQLRSMASSIARANGQPRTNDASSSDNAADNGLRFRAKGMASHRARLGLSASEFGQLIGASAKSVYAWEQGKSRPRAKHLLAIAELRRVGKREAQQRLAGEATTS